MKPIERYSLVDIVAERLQSQIASSTWRLGDRIPTEAKLAAELAVSRSSVREGVRALVQLGLLETRQGDGTYVVASDPTAVALRRTLNDADAREVLSVRRALDTVAAGEAAQRRTDAELAALADHLEQRRRAAHRSDEAAFIEHDVAFHVGVAAASHNRLLTSLYASFDESLRQSVAQNARLSMGAEGVELDVHEALYTAIRDRDDAAATTAALGVVEQTVSLMDQ